MSANTISVNHTQNTNLLLFMLRAYAADTRRLGPFLILGQVKEVLPNGRMWNILRDVVADFGKAVKLFTPLLWNGVRIHQISFVQLLDVGKVSTVKMGIFPHQLHYAVLHYDITLASGVEGALRVHHFLLTYTTAPANY
ncbi:hypothetical protein ADIMK_3215 [Marinobacterium lacunae]|uniref:Uncharacterized protein n=1 Tax=Marinobacterium lacunae TaxID=1232683 RepID=A0A081FW38_9GAMM|nr:hypothetical protein ADIMK_3215 [Marinobacterium lacunae]